MTSEEELTGHKKVMTSECDHRHNAAADSKSAAGERIYVPAFTAARKSAQLIKQ